MSRTDRPSNQADQHAADSSDSGGSTPDSVLAKLSESAAVGKQGPGAGKDTREAFATIGPDPRYDAVTAARQAIGFHETKDSSRSYLGTAISSLTSGDEKSLAQLKKLTADYDKATRAGNTAAAEKIKQDLDQTVKEDRKALELQDDITHYGSGFLKAAGLFMRGKGGLAGTAAAYALDQMNPNDPFKAQLLDGGLGVTKGLALKGIFHKLGQAEVGIAAKGVGLGVSSRFAELGLTRQTYMNLNGEYSGQLGLSRMTSGMLSKEALLTDVVVFGVAHNMVRGGNSLTGGAIDRSPLATTMLTAGSFGLLSGSSGEVHKQLSQGRSLTTMDYGKILKKGAIQGGIDLFAGVPGGLQARAAMIPPAESLRATAASRDLTSRLAPATETGPIRNAESAYLTLPMDGKVKGPIEETRREAPGVFSSSKEGEMWVPERDVNRIPYDRMGQEIAEVRSPLFAYEPLKDVTTEVLMATQRWEVDLTVKAKEAESAREVFVDAVKGVQHRIVNEGILNVNELHESAPARQQLAGSPDLLRIYDIYVTAREAHAAKCAELERAVKDRAADLQTVLDKAADLYGFARVKVQAYEDLGGSGAQYGTGSGQIKLRNEDLHNRTDTAGLVSKILHEMGHSVQDTVAIRHLADTLGIGKTASRPQMDALQALYGTRSGSSATTNWLETVLRHRDGVRLEPEMAEHAQQLLDGFRDYESPTKTLIETGNHYRMIKRQLSILAERNGGFNVVERLQGDKSGTLSEHLFGTKEPPGPVREIVAMKDRFDNFQGTNWPEPKVRAYLQTVLTQRLLDLNTLRRDAYTKYMSGVNEREAWLIGARAQVIAERLGGTTGNTKADHPDMVALREAFQSLSIH